jgi:hypothetical protein
MSKSREFVTLDAIEWRASSLYHKPICEGGLGCATLAAQSWVRRNARRT